MLLKMTVMFSHTSITGKKESQISWYSKPKTSQKVYSIFIWSSVIRFDVLSHLFSLKSFFLFELFCHCIPLFFLIFDFLIFFHFTTWFLSLPFRSYLQISIVCSTASRSARYLRWWLNVRTGWYHPGIVICCAVLLMYHHGYILVYSFHRYVSFIDSLTNLFIYWSINSLILSFRNGVLPIPWTDRIGMRSTQASQAWEYHMIYKIIVIIVT